MCVNLLDDEFVFVYVFIAADTDVKRAYPVMRSLTVATLSAVALSISSLFWTYSAAYASSIFTVILKGTMYATHISLMQAV